MEWISKILKFIGKLFTPGESNAIVLGLRQAAPYVKAALELVKIAQSLAPFQGNTWGTVMRYAEALGLPALFEGVVTALKVETALRDLTVSALRRKFPEASTANLNRAVEIAVGALKNLQKP